MIHLIAFFYGLGVYVPVEMIGTLRLCEITAIVLTPFLFLHNRSALDRPEYRRMMLLGVVWFVSLVVSDTVHETAFHDYIRGWANIGMVFFSLTFAMLVIGREVKAYVSYLVGVFTSGLLFGNHLLLKELPTFLEAKNNVWDNHVVPISGPGIALLAYWLYRKRPQMAILLTAFYGLLSMVAEARAHGLIFLLASALMWYAQKGKPIRVTGIQVTKISFACGVVFFALYWTYISLSLNGYFSESHAEQISRCGNPYNPVNLLRVGRAETFVALTAACEKPLLGHGSHPRGAKYWDLVAQLHNRKEHYGKGERYETIPIHSVFLQSWVWAGIGGAFIWIYVTIITVRHYVFFAHRWECPYLPLICFTIAYPAWHLFFSPMGFVRLVWPMQISLLIQLQYNMMRYEEASIDTGSVTESSSRTEVLSSQVPAGRPPFTQCTRGNAV